MPINDGWQLCISVAASRLSNDFSTGVTVLLPVLSKHLKMHSSILTLSNMFLKIYFYWLILLLTRYTANTIAAAAAVIAITTTNITVITTDKILVIIIIILITSSYATMVHGRGCNPHRSTTTFANLEIMSL